jgi:galactokinase
MSARKLFQSSYSRVPEGVYSAPGRVNLIGEHTDYTGGLVLPFAIDARADMAAARNEENTIRVVSAQRPGPAQSITLADLSPGTAAAGSWAGYVFGAVWALRRAGHPVGGFDLALDSGVPSGAGLSSSAAVECVTVLAAATLSGVKLDALEVARLAQLAENDFVGVPCGPMDQTASAAARAGSVLLFDTRAGTVEHIPFDPAAAGLAVLVLDTTVAHSLADGEYGKRRAACEKATETLGVASLREVTLTELPAALARLGDDELRKRVRHVVTENARVAATVTLLRRGHPGDIGPVLTASHHSLRDDYEVSSPELDQAVESALDAGAHGARMTGGGFGGSVIALVPTGRVDTVTRRVAADFAAHGFDPPIPRVVEPADGARRDS